MRDQALESQTAIQQLTQRVGAQSKSVENTVETMKYLLLQLEKLNRNFGNVQSNVLRWKENEERFIGDEIMETEFRRLGTQYQSFLHQEPLHMRL